ncbi:MAG: signal peptidase II [Candidatus Melainabacteria bacterium HGW-Melainabacteria-1]|nr:MAG: signal peptidase II [Candidatus Melainabacteria bacterium HGW-Melainabacteria-1]
MKSRFLIMMLICLPCVGCDQLTKYQATAHLAGKGTLSFFGDVLRLHYALNPGAWGGLGDQLPLPLRKLVFTIGVGLFLAILTWYILSKAQPTLITVGLSFILAGGIGNLIDRALYGHVVDFLYIGLEGVTGISWLHTNVFNVADMAIMAGAALLLIQAFKPEKPAAVEQTDPGLTS